MKSSIEFNYLCISAEAIDANDVEVRVEQSQLFGWYIRQIINDDKTQRLTVRDQLF